MSGHDGRKKESGANSQCGREGLGVRGALCTENLLRGRLRAAADLRAVVAAVLLGLFIITVVGVVRTLGAAAAGTVPPEYQLSTPLTARHLHQPHGVGACLSERSAPPHSVTLPLRAAALCGDYMHALHCGSRWFPHERNSEAHAAQETQGDPYRAMSREGES